MGGVVDAIVDVVDTIVDVVTDVVSGVVDFVGDVIGFVVNPFGAFDAPEVPDPGAAAQGVTVTRQGTSQGIPVVYGYRRVGGINVFTETNGESNAYLYVVYALCEGPILGVNRILVDDVELPVPNGVYSEGTTVSVTQGRFKNRIQFQCFYGNQTSQSSLANQSASWGKKSRIAPGLAYVVMRFEWLPIETQEDADNNPFKGGIPKVNFDVFGKKVFDCRTHPNGNLEFSQDYAFRSTEYNFNPANCLLDYLQNPRYGVGLPNSLINAESFRQAAEKFETVINYDNRRNGRVLTMNAVIDTSRKCVDNVKTLVGGCRGIFPFVQGRYKLKPEDAGNPTDITSGVVQISYDITKDVVVNGLSLAGERKNTKYNEVIVNFIDPDRGFSNQQVVYKESGDLNTDNNEPLVGEFTFHTITNPSIARDLAEMIYKKSRQQKTIQFTGTQELHDLEVGDIIRITDEVLLLNQEMYRVTGIKLRNDLLVDIECVEHDPQIYPFVTGPTVELPPPLYLPDTYTIFPLVRELPPNPISLVPIIDPDNPGIGNINNPTPPTPDPVDPPSVGGTGPVNPKTLERVTAFVDFQKPGPTGRWFRGYDSQFEFQQNTFLYTNGLVGLQYGGAQGPNEPYGMARLFTNPALPRGPFASMTVNLPRDTTIDACVIRQYANGVLIREDYKNIRDPNDQIPFFDERSGYQNPPGLALWFGTSDTVYTFRWIRSAQGQEMLDDSDFTTLQASIPDYFFGDDHIRFPGFTYTDVNGQQVTKTNIEGYLNFLNSFYHEGETTALSKTTKVNLGG